MTGRLHAARGRWRSEGFNDGGGKVDNGIEVEDRERNGDPG